MLKPASNSLKAIGLVAALVGLAPHASASWIDTDPLCQTYGCVIVHDGANFVVYDLFDNVSGTLVPVGSPLIQRLSGPQPPGGGGLVSPVVTGSLTQALTTAPLQDQGIRLGIDQTGDGIEDIVIGDLNSSGFLDAGDSLGAFQLSNTTDIVSSSTSYLRSFYITSSIDFELVATAIPIGAGFGQSLNADLSAIGFDYRLQKAGNDDGLRFGQRAQKGNVLRVLTGVTNLGDLAMQPTPLVDFRKAVAKKNATNIAEQSVRFDYVYDFGAYDMSLGRGEIDFEIEFAFHRR